jgi:hypothetical protein
MKCRRHTQRIPSEQPDNSCKRCWDAWQEYMASDDGRIKSFIKHNTRSELVSEIEIDKRSTGYFVTMHVDSGHMGHAIGPKGSQVKQLAERLFKLYGKKFCLQLLGDCDHASDPQLIAERTAKKIFLQLIIAYPFHLPVLGEAKRALRCLGSRRPLFIRISCQVPSAGLYVHQKGTMRSCTIMSRRYGYAEIRTESGIIKVSVSTHRH